MPGTELLLELMEYKRVIVDQLYEFAERQMELVRKSDITTLLALLSRKQHVILAVEALEQKLQSFREENPSERSWASPDAKKRCQECMDYCQEQLKQVMMMEKTAEEELIVKKNAVQEQIRQLDQGVTVHRAYHQLQTRSKSHSVHGLDLSSG